MRREWTPEQLHRASEEWIKPSWSIPDGEPDIVYITNRVQNRQALPRSPPRRGTSDPRTRSLRDLLADPRSYDTMPRHRQTAQPTIVWCGHGPSAPRETDQ